METHIDEIRQKFLQIEKHLNDRTLEREEAIEAVMACIALKEHVVLIGPPGTGKSRIALDAAKSLGDMRVFKTLLHRYIPPEEVLGPIDIKALENGSYVHQVEGYMPHAHLAYLDEVFNASSSFLNTLLNLLNERTFQGRVRPLHTVIGSSNQLPEGLDSVQPDVQTSRAIYDRFLMRVMVPAVQSDRNWVRIALGMVDAQDVPDSPRHLGSQFGSNLQMDYKEVQQVQGWVSKTRISRKTVEALLRLRAELVRSSVLVSDRRWRQCVELVKFRAWKNSAPEALPEHVLILKNALWTTPDQIPAVTDAVFACATPELAVARKMESDLVEEVRNLREGRFDNTAYVAKAIELNAKLMKKIDELKSILADKGAVPEVQRILTWMQDTQMEMALEIGRRTNINEGASASSSLGALLDELDGGSSSSRNQIGFNR